MKFGRASNTLAKMVNSNQSNKWSGLNTSDRNSWKLILKNMQLCNAIKLLSKIMFHLYQINQLGNIYAIQLFSAFNFFSYLCENLDVIKTSNMRYYYAYLVFWLKGNKIHKTLCRDIRRKWILVYFIKNHRRAASFVAHIIKKNLVIFTLLIKLLPIEQEFISNLIEWKIRAKKPCITE